jgi:acetate---CoA ligase (ADP-forming)
VTVIGEGGDLARLLRPRTVALFGGRACSEVIRQCRSIGYSGEIWPVHPTRPSLEGLATFPDVAALPGAPDAAFVAVNREATLEVVAALAARGAGGAVCYASGFAEVGSEGAGLQARLSAAAGAMPYFGPNCHGFINYLDHVALWPEQQGGVARVRGVALIAQSGNIALNLTMQRRALPIAYLITLGNQAMLGVAETIEAVLADPRVSAIGMHIEGIGDPRAFWRATQSARARGVPLVALKTGRSALGAQLALSHTASLAGADAVAGAFLHRAGVARVNSFPALLETLKLLHVHGPLPGRDIASMSCSGGEAALIADAATGHDLRLRALTGDQAARVAATLPAFAVATNPLDYHNFTWGDPQALTATYGAMLAAGFDLTYLVLDFPRRDRCAEAGYEVAAAALTAASREQRARAAIVSTLAETLPEEQAEALIAAGIAPLAGIDDALTATAAAADAGAARSITPAAPAFWPLPAAGHRLLSEWQAKRALAGAGVRVPDGALAATPDEAVTIAERIGYPVVVKASGANLAHKSELGAVRLNLRGAAAVREAAAALAGLGDRILVEAMVSGAVAELIVGIARDPTLGPYLVLGSGGVLVELVADRRILMLPADGAEIEAAIRGLKIGHLLAGHRGRAAGDLAAAVASVLAVQRYALATGERLLELDVNPLIVLNAGHGAIAVDALVRLAGEADHD